MPLHDWTRVEAGTFHGFHLAWIAALRAQLNSGLLPSEYYADAEQVVRPFSADVLTLHSPAVLPSLASPDTAVLETRPVASRQLAFRRRPPRPRQRRVVVRHVSGHRVVALIEIVSPANKDRAESVADFVSKAAGAVRAGVHVLVADVFPPGRHDPHGIAAAVARELRDPDDADTPPGDVTLSPEEPLCFTSFEAGEVVGVFWEPRAVGADLPTLPLFLAPGRYVNLPLGGSYARAFDETPRIWRDVLQPPA